VALETRTKFPEGSPLLQRADTAVSAYWVAGRSQFAVVLFGSSTCREIPISTGTVDEATVSVVFVGSHSDDPDHACASDRSPIAYFFSTPPSISEGDVTLTVTFDKSGSTDTQRIPITS
jgi:hypothetical protein